MSQEYEEYLAWRKTRLPTKKEPDPVYADFLMHYGVKGQKWGVRQWQNEDGTYTEAGKHHYGWGYGRPNRGQNGGINPNARRPALRSGTRVDGYASQPRRMGTRTAGGYGRTGMVRRPRASSEPARRQPTQEEIEVRKARTRKIIGIAAGVAVAAALTYAAYRGSTKLRDTMRAETIKQLGNPDYKRLNTFNSKYWTSADRNKYAEVARDHANTVANSITRREAVAAKISEKTGLRVPVHQSRQSQLAVRRSTNRYSNFLREAENRAGMNKQIHNARANVREAKADLVRFDNTKRIGRSKEFESMWRERREKTLDEARRRLEDLLMKRRAAG